MADFVSGFWNIYVMGLVALSILFCVFILVSNMKGKKGVDGEQNCTPRLGRNVC